MGTMIARKQRGVNDPSSTKEVEVAKATLKKNGWSYRTAAPYLGVGYQHLAKVLTGRRESRRLLQAIGELPKREEVAA